MKYLRYLRYLLRHKYFVFVAGLKTKAPLWRLIIHDWSKFMPCEFFPYAEQFYGEWRTRAEKLPSDADIHARFERAWLHHQHLNPHHWQHWVLVEDSPSNPQGKPKLLMMPDHFIREMVADWMGAGRAITGKWDVLSWYVRHRDVIMLEFFTRLRVEQLLGVEGEFRVYLIAEKTLSKGDVLEIKDGVAKKVNQ